MKMTIGRVYRAVRRIHSEGIFIVFFICLLIIRPIYAAPTCPTTTDKHKIVFCGPNVTYREWDCINCPHGLGLSVKCGMVYNKVYKVHCQPCKDGTYSDENGFGQCKPCSTPTPCQNNEVQIGECKSDHNTLRCKCKQGYYRAFTASCMPCSWCCGDKTNVPEDECRDLEKKCSYQDAKSCDPPTTNAPALNSTTPSTGKWLSTTPISNQTATTVITRSNVYSPNTTDFTSNGSKRSTDKKEIKRKSSDTEIKLLLIAILCPVLLIALAVICIVYFCRRPNGNSSDQDSSPEVSSSSSTANELNTGSSAPLIKGKNESATLEKNEKMHEKEEDQPLLQPHGSGTGRDGPVILDPVKDTAAYYVEHKGPNGKQPLPMANGTVPLPTTTLDKEKICFICDKLGPKLSLLECGVRQTLCEMLNVSIGGKGYRNLDAFCKLNFYQIKKLEQSQDPMEVIIDVMVSQSITLESFLEKLYSISRGDVVERLYETAKEKK